LLNSKHLAGITSLNLDYNHIGEQMQKELVRTLERRRAASLASDTQRGA
jgi:hypothetical protein